MISCAAHQDQPTKAVILLFTHSTFRASRERGIILLNCRRFALACCTGAQKREGLDGVFFVKGGVLVLVSGWGMGGGARISDRVVVRNGVSFNEEAQ